MRSITIAFMMKLTRNPGRRNAGKQAANPGWARAFHSARQIGLAGCVLFSMVGIHAEDAPIAVKIRNHQFIPAEIEIPAGEKRQLLIENEDATVEEFESHTLHREKIIPANTKVSVFVGPLKPGRYEFEGEYNAATAKGAVVAK